MSIARHDVQQVRALVKAIIAANYNQQDLVEGQKSPIPGLMQALRTHLDVSWTELAAYTGLSVPTLSRWASDDFSGSIQLSKLSSLEVGVERLMQFVGPSNEFVTIDGASVGIRDLNHLMELLWHATELWVLGCRSEFTICDFQRVRFSIRDGFRQCQHPTLYLVHYIDAHNARDSFNGFADFVAMPGRVHVIPVSQIEQAFALGLSNTFMPLMVYVYSHGSDMRARGVDVFQELNLAAVDRLSGEPSGTDQCVRYAQFGPEAATRQFDAMTLAFREIRQSV